MNSKGWNVVSAYLTDMYENNLATVESDSGVSNSMKLEASTKLGLIRKVIEYPSHILNNIKE